MEIKFIGTGSGKTSLKRFHSSILLIYPDYRLLIDAGDGISKALISQNIPFNSIDGIIISHLHPDHFCGLPSLIIQMKIVNRINNLDIFIHESLQNTLRDFILSSYIFNEKMDFTLNFRTFNDDSVCNVNDSVNFISRQNTHLEKYKKFDKSSQLSFSCSSFLFDSNGSKIQYTGDIGAAADLYLFKNEKPEILISEVSHIDINELIFTSGLLGIKKLILTHISDEDEPLLEKLTKISGDAGNILIKTAYDGYAVQV